MKKMPPNGLFVEPRPFRAGHAVHVALATLILPWCAGSRTLPWGRSPTLGRTDCASDELGQSRTRADCSPQPTGSLAGWWPAPRLQGKMKAAADRTRVARSNLKKKRTRTRCWPCRQRFSQGSEKERAIRGPRSSDMYCALCSGSMA
eukprot:gene11891-biopygen3387